MDMKNIDWQDARKTNPNAQMHIIANLFPLLCTPLAPESRESSDERRNKIFT
jgi:hypothetical protein